MGLPVQTLSVSPVSYLCLVVHLCLTLCNPVDYSPPGFSVHGDSPGKNTGVGCHAILQGICPTQGSNPDFLHCRPVSLPSEPPGKPIYMCVYIIYVCIYRWTSPRRLAPALAFLLQLTAISTIFISGAFMVCYLEN